LKGEETMERTMCKIFYCDRKRERRCCSGCSEYDHCSNHCLNGPERCNQSFTEEQKKEGKS